LVFLFFCSPPQVRDGIRSIPKRICFERDCTRLNGNLEVEGPERVGDLSPDLPHRNLFIFLDHFTAYVA
jgi:hypothetical protein